MSQIQIRIDEKTKKEAKKILDQLGIDMSAAIKVYLRQIVINKGIPLNLLTENAMSVSQEKEILKAANEAERDINVSPEMNIKDAIKYLNDLK